LVSEDTASEQYLVNEVSLVLFDQVHLVDEAKNLGFRRALKKIKLSGS
jgi:hypothetical protein